MVNAYNHHSCNGNDCLLVSATFFDTFILDRKVRLLFADYKICIENEMMVFQIGTAHTPVFAD